MEFRQRWLWIVVICVLFGGTGSAQTGRTEIRVLVYNRARLSAKMIDQVGYEVVRIFRAAGIEVTWLNCLGRSASAECEAGPVKGQFSLTFVPKDKVSAEFIYGKAFLGPEGVGHYADVFFEPVEAAHRKYNINTVQLLGAVAAHELGHLLLGLDSHSFTGLMAPLWAQESFHQLQMGQLFFTREQAALIRERVRDHETRIAGLEARERK